MTRPTTLPEWASTAGPADLIEPSTGKKESGWRKIIVGLDSIPEKPPYQEFNWWQNLTYEWIKKFAEGTTHANLYFVAKNGSNSNAGRSQDDAFLTIAAAVAVATSGETIVVLDGGIYTENFTLPSGVNLLAPGATIRGQITATGSDINIYRHESSASNQTIMLNNSSGGIVNYHAMVSSCSNTNCINIGTTGNLGRINAIVNWLIVSGKGIQALAGSIITVTINEMMLNQNNVVAIEADGGTTDLFGSIARVRPNGIISGSTGILLTNGAKASLIMNKLELTANTAYNVSVGSSLILSCFFIVGTQTGTATLPVDTTSNQTIGGTKTFTNSIVASITGNAATATSASDPNAVKLTGNQSIGGIKTFTSTIVGSINGNAGTVTNGVYTTGAQNIDGLKSFLERLSSRGSQGFQTSATAVTLTADSPEVLKILNPATTIINQDLPTTNVKAGKRFTIQMEGQAPSGNASVTRVRASNTNTVAEFYQNGSVTVVAKQDTPTTAAHWEVISYAAGIPGLRKYVSWGTVTNYITRNTPSEIFVDGTIGGVPINFILHNTIDTNMGVILAGQKFRINAKNISYLQPIILKAENGDELDRLGISGAATLMVGFIEVIALQDNPTTRDHWRVLHINEFGDISTSTPTFTATTAPSGGPTIIQKYSRINNELKIDWRRYYDTAGSGVTQISVPITMDSTILTRILVPSGWVYIEGTGGARPTSLSGPVLIGSSSNSATAIYLSIATNRIVMDFASQATRALAMQFILNLGDPA